MPKRKAILLETKLNILEKAKLTSLGKLATQFGLSKSTVQGIVQSKDSILEAIHNKGSEGKRSRIRASKFKHLEEALLEWFKNARSRNEQVSGVELKEQVQKVPKKLGVQNFAASNRWLDNFKHRHTIVFRRVQGEAAAINHESLETWKTQVLMNTLAEFAPNDVFNVDETAIFYHLLPNKTMTFKGENCTSGKKVRNESQCSLDRTCLERRNCRY